MLCAAAAQARPSFELGETSARAGDVVPFYISGVDDGATYELELDGDYLLDGEADGDVAGSFTVPDRGGEPWSPTIQASVRSGGRWRSFRRQLDYLGRPVPVSQAPITPAPGVGAKQQDSAPAGPTSSASPPVKKKHGAAPKRKSRPARRGHARAKPKSHRHAERTAEPRRRTHHRRHRRERAGRHAHRRSRQRYRHITGFYRGYAERGSSVRRHTEAAPSSPGGGVSRQATPAAAVRPGGGADIAIVAPVVLALAGLALAAIAVLRKRRLIRSRRRG